MIGTKALIEKWPFGSMIQLHADRRALTETNRPLLKGKPAALSRK
jgi:hypothetical protein